MNLYIIKLLLLISLIFQIGCDITLKRNNQVKKMDFMEKNTRAKNQLTPMQSVSIRDADIIRSYYKNTANADIRKDMLTHTKMTPQQMKKILVGENIPFDIQVVPLPLELEKNLSPLSLYVIRVQVGGHVILMDIKTRLIMKIIKI